MIPNLVLKKEININNLLSESYSKIKFENDEITIKLGKNHGAINKPIIKNNIIYDLKIYLTIELNKSEIVSKKLINNKIKETINHELQHIIELFFSNNLSSSWSFHKRLKEHQVKFSKYEKWMDICHIFYLSEDHEIRSRISQSLELIKNSKYPNEELLKSTLYKDFEFLSKINGENVLKIMRREYTDFDNILKDFIENVLTKNGENYTVFKKEIFFINKKAKESIKKILNILYFYSSNNKYFEEYIEREIDYKKFI